MSPDSSRQPEIVAWVREVNSRWIVHHGLGESAEAYVAHLEATDPARLITACERAARLVESYGPAEDPKPWFYAGLFSVVTVEEAEHYLADHWFTAQCVPSLAGHPKLRVPLERIAPKTGAKIARIRKALSEFE